ncbi:hypothetical protein ACFLWX_04390 [Chloroflexota bacterium]
MKRLVISVAILALLLGGCSQSSPSTTTTITHTVTHAITVDWVDFIQFDGITYLRKGKDIASLGLKLGSPYGAITFKLLGNVNEPNYSSNDGDAAFLRAGTQIYTLADYSPSFRLVALSGNRVLLYEADRNPNAKYGRDLLDIASKVKYISITSNIDWTTERGVFREREQVAALVDMVLDAPLTSPKPEFKWGNGVVFYMNDGTTVSQGIDLGANILSRGIQVPEAFSDAIREIVSDANTSL